MIGLTLASVAVVNLSPFFLPASPAAFTALGVALLLFVVYDVYATILVARAQAGPISETLNRGAWRMARLVAFRLSRPRRHRALHAVGPLLLPALVAAYVLILIAGFALIYYPHLPDDFNFAHAVESRSVEAFYFSGVTLTTVGYGDITPRTTAMRFVALFEAASGFALISLGVTYLLSVYRALERKRAIALSFYHQADEGADAAGFIAHHFVGGRFYGLEGVLRTAARDIQELLESHVEHPIIHYFHPVEVYKSLPRVLFLTLETCAVIRSCLDAEAYPQTTGHPEVRTLEASARHVLGELSAALNLVDDKRRRHHHAPARFEEARRWHHRHRQTLARLRAAGIAIAPDEAGGWELYRAQREEWEAQLYRFARFLGYEWDEVTGDGDLRYAADEEMEQPPSRK